FHVYHKHTCHYHLTQIPNPYYEKSFHRMKEIRQHTREAKAKKKARKEELAHQPTYTYTPEPVDPEGRTVNYFFHKPYLSFHRPPRTLRRGDWKHGVPTCLVRSRWFWNRYTLQFGDDIATPGVLDRRGVVHEDRGWVKGRGPKGQHHELRGYGVRTWRLWGESGRNHHREVNKKRKELMVRSKSDLTRTSSVIKSQDLLPVPLPALGRSPTIAEEVVYLKWSFPFSKCPRLYHFHYGGIDFYWKGTGTWKKHGFWGMWLRYNNLKLVASLPYDCTHTPEDTASPCEKEVVLARYESSIIEKKAGSLEIFDKAMARFAREYLPSNGRDRRTLETHASDFSRYEEDKSEVNREANGEIGEAPETSFDYMAVRRTRFYEVVLSTAMCMINSEWQKRETIKEILKELVDGAGGGGG
ncbi:hypothetical protein M501DRAFT_926858, partial [Patellaria atrata CBS 101060]